MRVLAMVIAILLSSEVVGSSSDLNSLYLLQLQSQLSVPSYHLSLETSRTSDSDENKEKNKNFRTRDLIRVLKPTLDPEIASIHAKYIDENAQKWNLKKELIISVAFNESQFNSCAISPKGAKGVMQVNAMAHRDKMKARGIKPKDLFLLRNNYDMGCEILSIARKNHKSLDGTLREYLGGRDPDYVRDVKRSLRKLNAYRA